MNGNYNVDIFYVPTTLRSLSVNRVDEGTSTFHTLQEPIKKVTFHYDLNVTLEYPGDVISFIEKMERDLQELKEIHSIT